jgi:exonuclease VII small subunit
MPKDKDSFKQHLAELGKILEWFDAQEELDVEEALKKVALAAELVAKGKERLGELENEFKVIKAKVEEK